MIRSLVSASLVGVTVVLGRSAFWWLGGDRRLFGPSFGSLFGGRLGSPLPLTGLSATVSSGAGSLDGHPPAGGGWLVLAAGWLAAGLLLAHAVWLWRRRAAAAEYDASRAPARVDRLFSPRRTAAAWMVVATLNVLLWPYALLPETFTVGAFVFWGSWLLFPVALAESSVVGLKHAAGTAGELGEGESLPAELRWRRRASWYLRAVTWGALGLFVIASGVYLGRARSSVGSVDFFFAVCNARDMLADPDWVPLNAYRYFPGAYAFWRGVMRWGGESLAVLQNAAVVVLILNAVLCSAVVLRMTRSYAAGVFASVWYLAASSRFQGLTGVMEPPATLPFLVGLLIWGGVPLRGASGLARAVAWGACLGLMVWFKQQAGLLALGAAWLLIGRVGPSAEARYSWPALLALPLGALATLLVGLLAEGHGWLPLRQGLGMLSSYPGEGGWLGNLYVQARGDESAAVAGVLLVLSLLAILANRERRTRLLGQSWLEVVGFSAVAAVAALIQFRTRAYGHYMLLLLPALIVGSVTLAARTVPRFVKQGREDGLRWGLLLLAATIPLAHTAGNSHTLHVWRLTLPSDFRPQRLWHQQPWVAADLARLNRYVEPGQRLYVLPPRHHSIHYLLGTRSVEPWGYGFRMPDLKAMPWERFDGVIVLTGGLDESDRRVWTAERRAEAERSLRRAGFRPRLRRPTFTLYHPGR